MRNYLKFEDLLGLTMKSVVQTTEHEEDVIIFKTTCGRTLKMEHIQDCCEGVYIESITGDLNDLVGKPILVAEEVTSHETPEGFEHEYEPESQTWTFYKLATSKGYVDIRWFGGSNGYYSEGVDLIEYTDK